MEAYIKSIKYVKVSKFFGYFKVTLIDQNANYLGTFGNLNFGDPENFRKETFGILSACNCYDLLTLGGKSVIPLEVSVENDEFEKVKSITNKSGITLYKTSPMMYEIKKDFLYNLKNHEKELKMNIDGIISKSGTFEIFLIGKSFGTFYTTGSIYYGFGYPFYTPEELDKDGLLISMVQFQTFITSILKLYKTDDLLKLNRKEPEFYRKVSVLLDESGKVIALGNEETDMYIVETEEKYEIVKQKLENIKPLIKKKTL